MSERVSPLAGKPAPISLLVNIPRLVTAYFALTPNPEITSQRVAFGTSGLNKPAEPEPICRAISKRNVIWPGPSHDAETIE